jgi:hypothetical protein
VKQPLRVVPTDGLSASSLVVIRRLDPADADLPVDDPFRLDRMRVVPNLDVPVSLAGNPQLSVYLAAFGAPGSAAPKMMLEFLQGDRLVARARPELPAPDETGRIQYVGTFPTATFTPGRYSIRAVLQQGQSVTETEAPVTVVP